MEVGIVGLGRMGLNLARQAAERGHLVYGYDPRAEPARVAEAGVEPTTTVAGLVDALDRPRILAVYVPHGEPTETVLDEMLELLDPHDIVIDGGNSRWTDSVCRHARFREAGVDFLDVGTSGGIEGARSGAAFMVGGSDAAFMRVRPLLEDLAAGPEAVHHAGPAGAGHFVKLVHNAIEFGMIQSIAEGVELLERSDYALDLGSLFGHWNHGTVIRSRLVELMGEALDETPDRSALSTFVEDTGEVKWVLGWALERDIPTPVVSAAQTMLMQYRDTESPAARAVALLRNRFGGHPVHTRDPVGG
ncbi:MAG: NADP-dependent phosphogluconate dehydrogenase [Gemmatimonadota bacterium]